MSALIQSLPRPSPQTVTRGGAERASAAVIPHPAADAQSLKPIGLTFANLAAQYRAKAGE